MSMMERHDKSITLWFTEEFKANAPATVVHDDRKIVDVAEALGVGEGALGRGIRLEGLERRKRAGLSRDDRPELVELRQENARLRWIETC